MHQQPDAGTLVQANAFQIVRYMRERHLFAGFTGTDTSFTTDYLALDGQIIHAKQLQGIAEKK